MKAVAWLFPGQGSQYVGMGHHLYQTYPEVRTIFQDAEALSGLPLRQICFHGPENLLVQPNILEPALSVVNLCYAWLLHQESLLPDAVAGYSAGEVVALYCAGVFDLHQALKVAVYRGQVLYEAAKKTPGTMTSIYRQPSARVKEIVLELQTKGYIDIAAWNAPEHTTVAGEEDMIWEAERSALQCGGWISRVSTGGPWHTPIVREATRRCEMFFNDIVFHWPHVPVYMNLSGRCEEKVEDLRSSLANQVSYPVQWYSIMNNLVCLGVRHFIEVGPGRVLHGLARYVWPDRKDFSVHNLDCPYRRGTSLIDLMQSIYSK